jgi:hypothetical protein
MLFFLLHLVSLKNFSGRFCPSFVSLAHMYIKEREIIVYRVFQKPTIWSFLVKIFQTIFFPK